MPECETSMSIEAMKMALEALEELNEVSKGSRAICLPAEIDTAMDALRQAIEQAEKQDLIPVAWIKPNGEIVVRTDYGGRLYYSEQNVYTTPPQRKPLTVDEIKRVYFSTRADFVDYARGIEAAHGIKEQS